MARAEWTAPATVPADHPCLAGHFPDRPVVPAVVLMELAVGAVLDRRPDLRLAAVATAKFLRPVLPAMPLTLHLSLDEDGLRARFRCALADGADAATGELAFTPATA